MHDFYLNSVKDTLLVGVPFIAILVTTIFRLDTLFWASKKPSASQNFHRGGCGMDASGAPMLVDPDGTPSGRPKRKSPVR
jgi:hypothetical protein